MNITRLTVQSIAIFVTLAIIGHSPASAKLTNRSYKPVTFPAVKTQQILPQVPTNKDMLPIPTKLGGIIPVRPPVWKQEDHAQTEFQSLMLAGWTSQPPGITITPQSVKAVSQDVAWIVGNASVVIKTTDGGATWASVGAAPLSGDLYNVEALDANTAFTTTTVGTTTKIWRTINGGTTWTEVYSATGFIDAIHMFDATNGIAVGDPVSSVWVILKTANGGATWTPIAVPLAASSGTEAGWVNSLAVFGSRVWFGTNSGRIYRSVDNGDTWTSSSTTFTESYSVSFINATQGISGSSSGSGGKLNRSTDGGVTWVDVSYSGEGTNAITGAACAGTRDFWICQGSVVYHSIDKGVSWSAEYEPSAATGWQHLNFVTYSGGDSTAGWVGGSGGGQTIGAYRDAVSPPPPLNDIRPILVVDPPSGSKRRANFSPQARYQNAGSGSQSAIPVRMEILDIGGSVIYSNVSAIAGPLSPEAEATVTFATLTIPATPGLYTARAISANPGDAIPANDTITSSFYVPIQLAGTYTVGIGGDFTTLKDVADTLTHNDVAAPVTFELITNGTYHEPRLDIDGVSYATTAQPVTIKPAAGVTARILGADSTVLGHVMSITNSANFIIDGSNTVGGTTRDLTIEADTTVAGAFTTVLELGSVRNLTIKNTNIKGYYAPGTGAIVAIAMQGSSTSSNRNVVFDNLAISRGSSNFASTGDPGNRDSNIVIRNCVLGTVNGSQTYISGVSATNVDSMIFHNNVVGPIDFTSIWVSDRDIYGLLLDGATRSSIYNNMVYRVTNSRTGAVGNYVDGIRVGGDATTSSNKVWNNMVWGLSSALSSVDARIAGIHMLKGSGDEVSFNSVYITGGTTTNLLSAAFQTDSTTSSTVRNNIFYNGRTDGTTGRSIALFRNSTSGASLTSNYNLLYAPGTTTGKLAAAGGTDYTDLTAWSAATSQDVNSRRGSPQFADANVDLHISTSVPTPVESGGTSLASITTDIDGNLRGGTPDIGADEGTFVPALANDMATISISNPLAGIAKKASVAFTPIATFANFGLSSQTNIPVRFRIYLASNLTTPVYEATSSIPSLVAGGTSQITFSSATISTVGNYIAYAITELAGDGNLNNDTLTAAFPVKNPLAGTYNIPSAEYPTLYSAVADLRGVGVSAAVTFLLGSPTYTLATQLVIDSVGGAGPSATVTFKPAPGVSPTITGSSQFALILFNRADYVTIDGSNTGGGTTRDLTIAYTPSAVPAAAVYFLSGGAGSGSRRNTIKNCNIAGDRPQNSSTATIFGVASGGGSLASATGPSDGHDNDSNTVANNYFSKLRIGIWLRGNQSNRDTGNTISGNLIGPTSFGADQIGRAGIVVQQQHNVTITQNEVRFVGGDLANTPAATVDRIGIGVGSDAWPAAQTFIQSSFITRNKVHDIVEERGGSAVGIVLAASYTITTLKNYVANNMVYAVRSNGSSAGKQTVGLAISYTRGDTVVYNSVHLSGDLDPPGTADATQSAAGIRISAAAVVHLFLKNNIFSVDVNSNVSTLKHYAAVVPAATYNWGTGVSNNNDFNAPGANPQMVLGGYGTTVPYTDVTTLAAWQTMFTPDQDLSSVAGDPLFTSATDLHITSPSSPASNAGVRVVTVPTDFDGQTRSTSTPDIGADEFASGGSVTLGVPVATAWNIVSLPVSSPTPDDSVRHLFTNSINPYAFAFVSGYVQRYVMTPGPGYWIKSSTTYTQDITGTAIDDLTIPVTAAWNMIGSISTSIDTFEAHVTPSVPGLRTSNFFRYSAGYIVATTIEPGLGYWVKAASAGSFRLHVSTLGKESKRAITTGGSLENMNTIVIKDADGGSQTLYFGADANGEIPVHMFVMPPAPPVGSFDARFASEEGGMMVRTHPEEVSEVMEMPIAIQSGAYPLMVSWKIKGAATYELSDGVGGVLTIRGEGTLKITNGAVEQIVLKATGASGLPKEFALWQNYPNPFNPSTNIKYALPVDSKLTIEIFNILGQNVRTLANEEQPAGYHILEWNGKGNNNQQLASGIYFLQMSATGNNGKKFGEIRKLMMMK